jgi:hypothetical protein
MVNNVLHRKAATVTNVYETYVVVSTGPTRDQIEILSGRCKPKTHLKVGDQGHIVYTTDRSSGLWFWEE